MIDLRNLSKRLGRPLSTLIALTEQNDPFYAVELPYRRAGAEWFAALWDELKLPLGVHVRRVHYRLVSLDITLPNGTHYVNTLNCSKYLGNAVRDAIYLDLLPGSTIVDNKNPEPEEFLVEATAASLHVYGGQVFGEPPAFSFSDALPEVSLPELPELPHLPSAWISRPSGAQRYHVEVWIEKSTMNDILVPLGQRHGINIVTGTGELSSTACRDVVDRAVESGRLASRILYVSDFDPKGVDMPVSVARKIEFEIEKRGLEGLDIQVRPVALTYAQCVQWDLPRTPTKETDRATAGFEARFGGGQTELDALEALYPGRLAQILTAEIRRYQDPTLARRVAEAAQEVEARIRLLVEENNAAFKPEHDQLVTMLEPIQQDLDELNQQFTDEVQRLAEIFDGRIKHLEERAAPIFEMAKRVCQ